MIDVNLFYPWLRLEQHEFIERNRSQMVACEVGCATPAKRVAERAM
jgi:hypothetical protein